jgi:UMF1 family MFS transporter
VSSPNPGPAGGASQVAWWRILSWQFYDFADTIYSMNVHTLYFALFITAAFGQSPQSFILVITFANLLVAVSSPVMGALSDLSRQRLPFLRFFAIGTALSTALIGFSDSYTVAVALYTISYLCYAFAGNFYQALLPGLCTAENVSRVSGNGVALGYAGALFGLSVMLFLPLGVNFTNVFPYSALLFLLFALPCLYWVPDFAPAAQPLRMNVQKAYTRVLETIQHARHYPGLFRFLVADFMYENAVNAVIALMAVYTKTVFGFTDDQTIKFFLVTIPAAILFGLIFGRIVDRVGPKPAVIGTLLLWLITFPLVIFAQSVAHIYGVGFLAGIGLSATWISSRTYLIALAPVAKSGEFFGLYALSGKSAGVAGSGAVALTLMLFSDRIGDAGALRAAIWVLWAFVLIGFFMVLALPSARPSRENILDRSLSASEPA